MENERRYEVRHEQLKQLLSSGVITMDNFDIKNESNKLQYLSEDPDGFDKPLESPKSPKIDPSQNDPINSLLLPKEEINPPQNFPPKTLPPNNLLGIEPPLVFKETQNFDCVTVVVEGNEVEKGEGNEVEKGEGDVVVKSEGDGEEEIVLDIVEEEDVALGNKFTKQAKQIILEKSKPPTKNISNSPWCLLPSSSVVWEYKIDHKWVPYAPEEDQLLEAAFTRKVPEFPFLEATCLVNLIKMKLIKISSSEEKDIRRYEKHFESYVLLKKNDTWKSYKWVMPTNKESTYLYQKGHQKEEMEIPLKSITEINYLGTFEKKNHVLGIVISTENEQTKKKYFISASTEDIAKNWVRLIQNQIGVLKIENEIPNLEKNSEIGKYSLCFPSISTAAFKFSLELASTIASEVIGKFLEKHLDKRIKLILVDIQESETLEAFRRKRPQDDRFEIKVGNLTKLDPPCWYIVNASNSSFEAGGSGTNAAIHKACSGTHAPSLKNLTVDLFGSEANVAVAYPVDLPLGCPLRDSYNVHTIIHVVGPNMCPKRANCLDGDYHKGALLLRNAYESILDVFVLRSGLD